MKSALVLLVWLVAAVTTARKVHAQDGARALVIAEQTDGDPLTELSARLRGELSAAGFSVSSTTCAPGVAPREAISSAPADAMAVILVRGELHGAQGVELWISDRVLGATSNARLASDHPDPSERARRISVEAAELLRARLAELLLHQNAAAKGDARTRDEIRPSESARTLSQPTTSTPEPVRPWLAAGLTILAQPRFDQVTLMPSLSMGISWQNSPDQRGVSGALGAHVSGYGQTLRHEREQGELELRQGIGTIDVALSWLSRSRISPEFALSAGVHGLGLRGQGVAPFFGRRQRDFSALLGASLGAKLRLLTWLSLRAVTGPLRALHETSLQIVDTQVARAGGLLWLSRLELWGVLW